MQQAVEHVGRFVIGHRHDPDAVRPVLIRDGSGGKPETMSSSPRSSAATAVLKSGMILNCTSSILAARPRNNRGSGQLHDPVGLVTDEPVGPGAIGFGRDCVDPDSPLQGPIAPVTCSARRVFRSKTGSGEMPTAFAARWGNRARCSLLIPNTTRCRATRSRPSPIAPDQQEERGIAGLQGPRDVLRESVVDPGIGKSTAERAGFQRARHRPAAS
jgi:hypothetical protein